MKFDFVIGNPPYQENLEHRSEQPPVYHYFYDSAIDIADNVEFITPGRFLFDAGKTPRKWNDKMLNDVHFKVLQYEQKSSKIFPNTDIKGGVAITYRSKKKDFGAIKTFIHLDELRLIKKRINVDPQNNFSKLVWSNTSYKYNSIFFKEHPEFKSRVSGGSKRYLSSSVFDKFPEAFYEKRPGSDYIKIIGLKGKKRKFMWFNRNYLNPPDNFEKFKVIIPASNGSGALGEALSTPLVGEPLVGHTETFISIGSFEIETQAIYCMKYIKTKFARTCLGIKKITQGNKRPDIWSEIPLQDFTSSSDIDWSQSIANIDKQLYKKYNLTEEEITFIESNVKEME